jgi:hypothetical protein
MIVDDVPTYVGSSAVNVEEIVPQMTVVTVVAADGVNVSSARYHPPP